MYVQHFGLKKRPFRAKATGTDVFVGPQTVTAIAGLKTALQSNDSVVTVAGPVGAGKSTLVTRALESVGEDRIIVKISRMRLTSNDVLEHLLSELGADTVPGGTIRKFTEFRRQLLEHERTGTRVFVVVEDATRLDADTLAELEAVTAADAGDSEGASLVLMGDERLEGALSDPALGRLTQRIRQRHVISTLPVAELRGYLRHCFRLAGADFETIFEADAPDLLHHLGDGVPRTTNNLVESALSAATTQGLQKIPSSLISEIANHEYGLSLDGYSAPATVPAAPAAPEPVPEPEQVPELVAEPEPVPDLVAEPEPQPEPVPEPADEPVLVFADDSAVAEDEENEIPELIQDTLPDLEVLAPELAAIDSEPPVLTPDPEAEVEPEAVPELELADTETPESTGGEVSDWDRDPTFAELKPDIAALEEAMAVSTADSDDAPPVLEPEAEAAPEPEPEEPEEIPEITLDNAINERIQNTLIDEPGEASPNVAQTAAAPSKKGKKADAEIEKIAAELAKAKSIEDVDDKMAETLFGEEISIIAAQVIANPPSEESANEELEALETQEQAVASGVGSVALELSPEPQVAAAEPPVPPQPAVVSAEPTEPSVEVTLEEEDTGMDLSASQRLKTVRALNADLHPSLREPDEPVASEPAGPVETPGSIEDQIDTSMTETLKALNISPPISNDADEDDDEKKGGFFSRFKRS